MSDAADSTRRLSEVAMWHRLSGMPDNVTDDGEVVEANVGARLCSEKAHLRATIADLSTAQAPNEVRGLARLAASYLLAGDVETAARYVSRARDLLSKGSASNVP